MINLYPLEEMLAMLLGTNQGRRIGLGVACCAGVLLCYTFFSSFWVWHADYVLAHKPLTQMQSADDSIELIGQLPARHIFGDAGEADDFLPITNLQLHLTGIVKDGQSGDSRAIIAEAGNPGKIYNIGSEVTAGIKISAITSDSVVLEHGGHLEKLPLVRMPLMFQDSPMPLTME